MLTIDTVPLHIRFSGRSEDLDLAALGLPADADDAALRAAIARRYEQPLAALADYVVVREKQAIIVRPAAFDG